MSCDGVKNQLPWYLYNELDEAERTAVEEHVEGCAACAARMEEERAFLATLNVRETLEPSPALVAESRHDLMRSIYRADRLPEAGAAAGGARIRSLREVWQSWRFLWQPAAALCLLMIGFLGGWRVREGRVPVRDSIDLQGASIANISGVNLDSAAGKVEISFDEMRRQTLSGRLEDRNIQQFLIYAARNYGNPGVRLETIDILKDRAADGEIRDTLLELVSTDTNAGVRLKALDSLKQYSQEGRVRQALIGVLTKDDNPGMRVQAIDLLMEAQDHNLVEVLQGVAQKEQNNYVRMRCRNALRELNASVETF